MGTHPIFESDFDCLTEFSKQNYGSRIRSPSPRTHGPDAGWWWRAGATESGPNGRNDKQHAWPDFGSIGSGPAQQYCNGRCGQGKEGRGHVDFDGASGTDFVKNERARPGRPAQEDPGREEVGLEVRASSHHGLGRLGFGLNQIACYTFLRIPEAPYSARYVPI